MVENKTITAESQIAGKNLFRVNLDGLRPHPSDPFKPYSEGKLGELAGSMARYGLLEPVIIRAGYNGGYEILAGKNRVNAARLNGWTEIDAFRADADDETAVMIITDSNLKHRDELLPSERGFAYRLQLKALKRQGKRYDLSSRGDNSESAEKVALHNKISAPHVRRFIRLTYLIKELLDKVDGNHLPIKAGVDISFLDGASQSVVFEFFYMSHDIAIDTERSKRIKTAFHKKKSITVEILSDMFLEWREIKSKAYTINRSVFKSIAFGANLPDDGTLSRMFIEFLRGKFNKDKDGA